ncbi:MAG: tetratricopeptide repeat protein, partial [Thermoguttaceae bacterium]
MAQLREWLAAPPPTRDGRPDPAAIRWRLELARHHWRLGELDDCLRLAREVLAIVPPDDQRDLAFALDLIADVLYVQGEFDEAIQLFQRVDRQSEYYVKARFFEGIAHVRNRRAQPAITAFRAITEAIEEGVTGVEDVQRMRDLAWLSLARVYYTAANRTNP